MFVLSCCYCGSACCCLVVFFFKQKTAYEMRISDWSSDVCSSDLGACGSSLKSSGFPTASEPGGLAVSRLAATPNTADAAPAIVPTAANVEPATPRNVTAPTTAPIPVATSATAPTINPTEPTTLMQPPFDKLLKSPTISP